MVFGIIAGVIAAALVSCVIAGTVIVSNWLKDLPDYSNIEDYSRTGITTIYASDRTTKLAEIALTNRIQVDSSEISENIKDAVVSVEDERFYQHGGIDPQGIARALVSNLGGGSKQGASTLTQQLVRNTVMLDDMHDMSARRKVREMYIAIQLEKQYSKDQILSMYLNTVNFGDGNYGVESASNDYFGKHASELTLSEASLLAGIPNSPTMYNPRTHYSDALERRAHVLDRMLATGAITQEEHDEALADEPTIVPAKKDNGVSNIAPYFVDYVKQVVNDNASEYGISSKGGGYDIYTTLDIQDQQSANDAVASYTDGKDIDASITSINPANGYVTAMVGGKDYDADNFNLSTQMSRQAGSTFKTFTLIAALQNGVAPNTKIDATQPADINGWIVKNASGDERFKGPISLSDAYKYSLNTVFARLAHGLGAQTIVDTAHAMGVQSDLESVESVTLGTQGVNTMEMASAYATIANGGVYYKPEVITDIEDSDGGNVYTHNQDNGVRVISEAVAAEATSIMESVIDEGTGKSAKLDDDRQVAGKTGTSEKGRDLWFCGFTPQKSAAVWTGYRNDQSTKLYGGTSSTPLFKDYMDSALSDEEKQDFPDVDTSNLIYRTNWSFDY